jgi:hypothetical protein
MTALQSSGFWFTLYPLLVPVVAVLGFAAGYGFRGWRASRRRPVA